MKLTQMILAAVGVMAVGFPVSADPIVIFSLSPANGVLAGQAGTAVGWDYSISTDSAYVTIQNILFGDGTPIGTFSTPGIPFTVASAGSPITAPWIMDISGLQYDIFATAILGASTQGLMTLIYDAYSDADLTDQIVWGGEVNAQSDTGADLNAEVSVNAEAVTTVPEPGSAGLLGIGICCAALAAVWRTRRGQVPIAGRWR
ncbi:MAG: PEP-CTERM sorting domain-containing protein [Candidatus Solibacter sp.]|nr:PEP-CTERM sorting domain-containing protein [Candidatus Solibacter sp.]